jgi:Ca-activated chloride channel family protein
LSRGVQVVLFSLLGLCLLAIAGSLGLTAFARSRPAPAPDRDAATGRVLLQVAYSPDKATLFSRLIDEFNKSSKTSIVRATKVETQDMLDNAIAGQYTAISPDSAAWLSSLDQRWLAKYPDRSALAGAMTRYAVSPVVIAAWQPAAAALGYPDRPIGWNDLVRKVVSDPNFRWSHPASTTATGLLTTIAEFYAASGKSTRLTTDDLNAAANRDFVRRIEKTVQQYGGESEDETLARLLRGEKSPLDAFVAQEQLVVRYNAARKPDRLVAIYPAEGTLWMDHPLVLLEGEWVTEAQRRAFRELADYVRSPAGQKIVLQEGYRPADLQVAIDDPASLIRSEYGADPAQPFTLLPLPGPSVVDAVSELWAILKRPANIYLVADVSGSMEGAKLDKAKEALLSFIGQVRGDDENIGLITFSSTTREAVRMDALGKNRTLLASTIQSLSAGGETALYDATLFATERLAARKEVERINVVLVMTDGQENASRRAAQDPRKFAAQLQAASTGKGVPVLIFTVAYGQDADLSALQRIAEAGKGQSFPSDPTTIRRLYQKLSAYF